MKWFSIGNQSKECLAIKFRTIIQLFQFAENKIIIINIPMRSLSVRGLMYINIYNHLEVTKQTNIFE